MITPKIDKWVIENPQVKKLVMGKKSPHVPSIDLIGGDKKDYDLYGGNYKDNKNLRKLTVDKIVSQYETYKTISGFNKVDMLIEFFKSINNNLVYTPSSLDNDVNPQMIYYDVSSKFHKKRLLEIRNLADFTWKGLSYVGYYKENKVNGVTTETFIDIITIIKKYCEFLESKLPTIFIQIFYDFLKDVDDVNLYDSEVINNVIYGKKDGNTIVYGIIDILKKRGEYKLEQDKKIIDYIDSLFDGTEEDLQTRLYDFFDSFVNYTNFMEIDIRQKDKKKDKIIINQIFDGLILLNLFQLLNNLNYTMEKSYNYSPYLQDIYTYTPGDFLFFLASTLKSVGVDIISTVNKEERDKLVTPSQYPVTDDDTQFGNYTTIAVGDPLIGTINPRYYTYNQLTESFQNPTQANAKLLPNEGKYKVGDEVWNAEKIKMEDYEWYIVPINEIDGSSKKFVSTGVKVINPYYTPINQKTKQLAYPPAQLIDGEWRDSNPNPTYYTDSKPMYKLIRKDNTPNFPKKKVLDPSYENNFTEKKLIEYIDRLSVEQKCPGKLKDIKTVNPYIFSFLHSLFGITFLVGHTGTDPQNNKSNKSLESTSANYGTIFEFNASHPELKYDNTAKKYSIDWVKNSEFIPAGGIFPKEVKPIGLIGDVNTIMKFIEPVLKQEKFDIDPKIADHTAIIVPDNKYKFDLTKNTL